MPKLTKRSLGICDGFISKYKRDDIIQKLGYIEHGAEAVAREMCDYGCRFPLEADEDELATICEACPMTRLMEMIG